LFFQQIVKSGKVAHKWLFLIIAGYYSSYYFCKVNVFNDYFAMKKVILAIVAAIATQYAAAQTLEKMNWFNEPADWRIDGVQSYYGCHASQ